MVHGKVLRARSRMRGSSRSTPRPPRRCRAWSRFCSAPSSSDFDPYWGHAIKDRPILAIDRVRFAGEPVAAVAAEDEAIAEAALREIVVEYEELPVVGTVDEAIAADAPLVHDGPLRPGLFHGLGKLPEREGNVCYRYRLDAGSVELAEADAGSRSRATTSSPPSTSTRWRPTPWSPSSTATRSPSGRPASTRSWSGPRSPPCSSCRSGACG